MADRKKVFCIETGEMFCSYAAAGKAYDTSGSNISYAVRHGAIASGFHWSRLSGNPVNLKEIMCKNKRRRRSTPVQCVETGEVFPSFTKAAEFAYLKNPSNIARAVRDHGMAGGYHWRELSPVKYAEYIRKHPQYRSLCAT